MSKLPSRAVAVCALGPSFVQVIVSPTCTVIVLGLNWKSEIATAGSLAAWARRAAPGNRLPFRCVASVCRADVPRWERIRRLSASCCVDRRPRIRTVTRWIPAVANCTVTVDADGKRRCSAVSASFHL